MLQIAKKVSHVRHIGLMSAHGFGVLLLGADNEYASYLEVDGCSWSSSVPQLLRDLFIFFKLSKYSC